MAKLHTVTSTTADILHDPQNIQTITNHDSQLLFGEIFSVEKEQGEWLYGTSVHDGYIGHIHKDLLSAEIHDATHTVYALRTHFYPEPSFKTRPAIALSFGSRVHLSAELENGFLHAPNHGWIYADHVEPVNHMPAVMVTDIALQFLGTPYLYGGRSSMGLDCSALIQLALNAHNIACPRDSGEQAQILGHNIDPKDLQRGDLVFFEGHVGIMVDDQNILNATARTMDTRIENLENLIEFYEDITATKRLTLK